MTRKWMWVLGCAVAAWLLIPVMAAAIVAKTPSRGMTVRVRTSTAGVLDTFQSAAKRAGLTCKLATSGKYKGAVCSVPDRPVGYVQAYDVTDKRVVVVQAFSKNVFYPQGELDASLAAALDFFRYEVAGNPEVERVDYCRHPDYDACR